ncbi:tellurite resistance TerB family protein [Methylobacterium brachiatum]
MFVVGLTLVVVSAAGQIVHDHWPFLLIALGAVGCVWGIMRQRAERAAMSATSPIATGLTRLASISATRDTGTVRQPVAVAQDASATHAASIDLSANGAGIPQTSKIDHALPAPVPDRGDPASLRESVAAVAVQEPEFRISAIVDAPRSASSPPRDRVDIGKQAGWIPPGQVVELKKLTIDSGMFYFGEKRTAGKLSTENCLIDPTLPVAPAGSGSTVGMTYWSRYDSISPAHRRAYLDWLASGRSDPSASIGLAFLFFYGLEYRLFKEQAVGDRSVLVEEVERLLGLYGSHHSFQGYAKRFLEAAQLTAPDRPAIRPEFALDAPPYGYEMPLDARIWLGRKLAGAQPLDADDALLWLAVLPDRGFRTPVTRCPEEFRTLWRSRFAAKHPSGLKVSAPKGRIKATYRAASATFEVPLKGPHENLPDIGAISAPVRKLRDLVEACTVELEAFSRLVGKRPEARSSAQAALLLPQELAGSCPAWVLLQDRAEKLFAGRPTAAVSLADLFGLAELPHPAPGRVAQSTMNELCRILDRAGVAFEPDRRYGGQALDSAATVCAFQAQDGAPVDPERPEYRSFRSLVDITCLAAASDGTIAHEEIETILIDLRDTTVLNPAERARLIGYAYSIQLDPPKQQAVLKRLAASPLAEREACSRAALAAVMADGYAAPSEVKFLERLHTALALPVEAIYTAIHRDVQKATNPLPDTLSDSVASASHLTHPVANVAVAIDASRLDRIRRETQAVSDLLSGIFVDDTAEKAGAEVPFAADATSAPPALDASASDGPVFPGLDPAHGDLLAVLLASASTPRVAFDLEARSRRLLPDGALETINEWAFDQWGDALLEGEDHLTVSPHLRELLPRIEIAA